MAGAYLHAASASAAPNQNAGRGCRGDAAVEHASRTALRQSSGNRLDQRAAVRPAIAGDQNWAVGQGFGEGGGVTAGHSGR
jgi:hypothetical protein